MILGKAYKLKGVKTFPFGEPIGVFLGQLYNNGWYRFKLGGTKECIINPTATEFEEIEEGVILKEDSGESK